MDNVSTAPNTRPNGTLGERELVELGVQLLAYAHRYAGSVGLRMNGKSRTVNARTIEDLVQECVLTLIDPDSKRRWNPDTMSDPLRYLISVFNSKLSAARRRERKHTELGERSEPIVSTGVHDTPETFLLEIERIDIGEKALDVLLECIVDDEALMAMYDAIESGLEKPSDIAKQMNVDVRIVYNLSKRFDRACNEVASQLRAELQLNGDSDG